MNAAAVHIDRAERVFFVNGKVTDGYAAYLDVESAVEEEFFQDERKASIWMETPNLLFGGMTPGDYCFMRPNKAITIVRKLLAENLR